MRGAKCVIYVVVGEFGKLFRELLIVSFFLRRSEEHTSELQSQSNLVCRLLLEKKKAFHRRFFAPSNRRTCRDCDANYTSWNASGRHSRWARPWRPRSTCASTSPRATPVSATL